MSAGEGTTCGLNRLEKLQVGTVQSRKQATQSDPHVMNLTLLLYKFQVVA